MSSVRRVASHVLEGALAALFPADCLLCGQPLPWRQKGSVCLPCWAALPWTPGFRLRRGALPAIMWAADYDGDVRRLIHGFKFESMDYLGTPLGEEAAARLAPLLTGGASGTAGPLGFRPDLIVPVPLHWWRRYRRGFNQALLLARPFARATGVPLAPCCLARPRAGRRQLGLTRRERLRSLEACFRAPRAPGRGGAGTVTGRSVLLIDDVVTTGATLLACARTLLRAGALRVGACVLARTPRRPRPAPARRDPTG